MALDIAKELFLEEELIIEVVIPSQIAPLPKADLLAVKARCSRFIILEEGTERFGWGAEIIALFHKSEENSTPFEVVRLASLDSIIPNSFTGEQLILPNKRKLTDIVRSLSGKR